MSVLAEIFYNPSQICHGALHTHSEYDSACLCTPEANHCLCSVHFALVEQEEGGGQEAEDQEQVHHRWSQRSE